MVSQMCWDCFVAVLVVVAVVNLAYQVQPSLRNDINKWRQDLQSSLASTKHNLTDKIRNKVIRFEPLLNLIELPKHITLHMVFCKF